MKRTNKLKLVQLLLIMSILLIGINIPLARAQCSHCDQDQKECKDTSAQEANSPDNFQPTIKNLSREITLLNLINGLNLSQEQIHRIIELNEKTQALKQKKLEQEKELLDRVIASYQELKKTLEKNQGIPKELEQRAFKMEKKAKQLGKELTEQIVVLENQLKETFSEAQLEIVNTFNPCLIPPKDLKDPVRAGQANDNPQGRKVLRRIREAPDRIFEDRIDFIIDKHIETIQKQLGNLTEQEIETEAERLYNILEEARAMSDVEFELNASDLAKKLKPPHKEKEMREELAKLHKTRRGGLDRVGQYFFDPLIVPVLKKRLQVMKNQPQIIPVNLDKINKPNS